MLAAVAAAMILGLFLALCAVTWRMDQIIAGTVINIFVAGITSFLYTQGKQSPGGLDQIKFPLLSEIPLLGRAVFTNTPIAYMAIVLVFVLHVGHLPHPLGPAQPVRGRAPERGRHRRHQRRRLPLPEHGARRRAWPGSAGRS